VVLLLDTAEIVEEEFELVLPGRIRLVLGQKAIHKPIGSLFEETHLIGAEVVLSYDVAPPLTS
jgi:hypothetical protein